MNKLLSPQPVAQDWGIALVRIITGILLVWHGAESFSAVKMNEYTSWFVNKNYAAPAAWAYAGKIAELLAGIGFTLGLFTRLAALASVAAFTGIIFLLGAKGEIFQGDQHPFLFILLSVVFFVTGAGTLSLDRIIFKKK